MTTSPPQTLLEHMQWLAAELNCVVVYRLGMFHFIPKGSNLSDDKELASGIEASRHLLAMRPIEEKVARAIHSKRQELGFGGQARWECEPVEIHVIHNQTAQAAIDACHAGEMVALLKRLTAPYTGDPDGEPLEAIISDADDLLAKLESKS